MTTTALTSELDAINTMLDCIGEAPVSSLEVSGLGDVAKAKQALDEVSREVQTDGWDFNTDAGYTLPIDGNGFVLLAPNMLGVDTDGPDKGRRVTQRGNRMYDKDTRSFIFTQGISCEIVWLFPFDELPQHARQYIMIRAARRFTARNLGSEALHRFSETDELAALALLKDKEADQGDYNMLTGSMSVASALDRSGLFIDAGGSIYTGMV